MKKAKAVEEWLGGLSPALFPEPTARSKYRAVKTEVDGHRFDSKREAARYAELRALERAGKIHGLELQPRFPIEVNGHLVCVYVADFRYRVGKGRKVRVVVEDSKGIRTPVYRLKKKLVLAVHGIEVQEV